MFKCLTKLPVNGKRKVKRLDLYIIFISTVSPMCSLWNNVYLKLENKSSNHGFNKQQVIALKRANISLILRF